MRACILLSCIEKGEVQVGKATSRVATRETVAEVIILFVCFSSFSALYEDTLTLGNDGARSLMNQAGH